MRPQHGAADERSVPVESGADMTRSEEQLNIDTETRPVATAQMHQHVVEEHSDRRVTLRYERARLVRETITDADRDLLPPSAALVEGQYEIRLHAERPVMATTLIPIERVRLATHTVTVDEDVHETVRREQFDTDSTTTATEGTT